MVNLIVDFNTWIVKTDVADLIDCQTNERGSENGEIDGDKGRERAKGEVRRKREEEREREAKRLGECRMRSAHTERRRGGKTQSLARSVREETTGLDHIQSGESSKDD